VSWDIFVQDLPADAKTLDKIPDDFRPASLMARSTLIERIKEVAPEADFGDPTWGRIEGPSFSIEVNLGGKDPVESFAFHVRSGDMAAGIVSDILDHLGLRALDPGSDSGFFDRDGAVASLTAWRAYRDHVLGRNADTSSAR
jgi:hypothetical protein